MPPIYLASVIATYLHLPLSCSLVPSVLFFPMNFVISRTLCLGYRQTPNNIRVRDRWSRDLPCYRERVSDVSHELSKRIPPPCLTGTSSCVLNAISCSAGMDIREALLRVNLYILYLNSQICVTERAGVWNKTLASSQSLRRVIIVGGLRRPTCPLRGGTCHVPTARTLCQCQCQP
jgi:hypothetical protein